MTITSEIHQTLETWIGELPVDAQTGAVIATSRDIDQLAQHLALCFKGDLVSQQTRWLSLLVQLYTQSAFKNQTPTSSTPTIRELENLPDRVGVRLPSDQSPTLLSNVR